jgi:SAM-dependent methyltransferase
MRSSEASPVPATFDRSGLAALSDLTRPEHQAVFSLLEEQQAAFQDKEPKFRSDEYKWPRDPLHNFSRVWEYPYVYHHLAAHIETLPKGTHPVVADVGSGVTFFPFAVAKLGYSVVCTDIDPICERDLSSARACVSQSPGSVDFRLIKDGCGLPFGDEECDAVYCISVVEHIPDFEKTIAEVGRILKPGGLCLFTCDINMTPGDGFELDFPNYVRLMAAIDGNFVRVYPDRTVHPADMLSTTNSPYPYLCGRPGIAGLALQAVKQRILKPLLGRKPGPVIPRPPNMTILGLVLRKEAQTDK